VIYFLITSVLNVLWTSFMVFLTWMSWGTKVKSARVLKALGWTASILGWVIIGVLLYPESNYFIIKLLDSAS
jgi:mannose/fructose/N-acetylgalactosamine-specific phosphotransferase system component IID